MLQFFQGRIPATMAFAIAWGAYKFPEVAAWGMVAILLVTGIFLLFSPSPQRK